MHTVADVSKRYGVTPATVITWIRTGELKAVNVARSPLSKKPRWRVSEQALAEFESRRTTQPPLPKRSRQKCPAGVIEFYK